MTGRRPLPPARRRWGQNFLADPSLARSLAESFDAGPEDAVVEIGPGRGALSVHLASRAGSFVALEIDPQLITPLERLLAPWPRASVIEADALEIDWEALGREAGGRLRVIGNFPYNVGTAIVRRLLASRGIADIQCVLQLEVVERILANEGTKAYGPMSIVAALRAERRRLRVLEPGSFRPRPKVRSAALRLEIRSDSPLEAEDVPRFEALLFRGFAQRRKTLAGNLGEDRERVRAFLRTRALPEDARAEALPPETWLSLARELTTD